MRMVRENPWRTAVAVSVMLVVVGAVLVVRGSGPGLVAWFGSAPTSDTDFSPGVQLVTTQRLWGLGVGAAGLLVLVACSAYALGLRRGRDGGKGAVPPSSGMG